MKKKVIKVFTDASLCPITKAWGIGVWLNIDGTTCKFTRSGINMFKNIQRIELHAIHEAISYLYANFDTRGSVLTISSDSTVAIGNLNKQSTIRILELASLKIKHVKAHKGIRTVESSINTIVDSLAYAAMLDQRVKVMV